eukprot:g1973.t1
MWRFVILAGLLCIGCHTESISLQIEHRLDNINFEVAGIIKGLVSEDGSFDGPFTLKRDALTEDQISNLKQLAKVNGYYSVRVRSVMTDSTSDYVMASIPVHCLLSSNSEESLSLELTYDNKVISMDYRSNCPKFTNEEALEVFQMKEIKVNYRYPIYAARLSMEELVRKTESVAPPGTGGKPETPQKPQKTWLQQNWVFVLAGALFMFQLLGAVADPNAMQQNQAAEPRR